MLEQAFREAVQCGLELHVVFQPVNRFGRFVFIEPRKKKIRHPDTGRWILVDDPGREPSIDELVEVFSMSPSRVAAG